MHDVAAVVRVVRDRQQRRDRVRARRRRLDDGIDRQVIRVALRLARPAGGVRAAAGAPQLLAAAKPNLRLAPFLGDAERGVGRVEIRVVVAVVRAVVEEVRVAVDELRGCRAGLAQSAAWRAFCAELVPTTPLTATHDTAASAATPRIDSVLFMLETPRSRIANLPSRLTNELVEHAPLAALR